jgi:tight adherence protein C
VETAIVVGLIWLAFAIGSFWIVGRVRATLESRRRLFTDDVSSAAPPEEMGRLRRWLFLAGYRDPSAPSWFIAFTAITTLFGIAIASVLWVTGLAAAMVNAAAGVPGGVGEVFLPAVFVTPWLMILFGLMGPWLWVTRTRRLRVEAIERELPISLDLLATLSEAGLGFDAGLARIQNTDLGNGPLAGEFRSFQADLVSGRPRVQALRRLASRIEISSASVFVSALVQAEQLGMGIASILRRQADDLRDRRRERALAFAMSLPVKRVVPMVVCFLPGLFVWTLGPFFVQLFQLADALTKTRS